MKRIVASLALFLCASLLTTKTVFAGDAAVFSDIGFSSDGKVYVFGQYGKLDKTYEAWAEIYTVDVAGNVFVKNEVYKTKNKSGSGKNAYDRLLKSNSAKIDKYNCSKKQIPLYVRESNSKAPDEEIVFKDFDGSEELGKDVYYNIKLVSQKSWDKGSTVQSSFYINLEKKDSEGNVLYARKVGTPDYWRKNITSYRIDRIFTDPAGKSLVFIVEKTLKDDKGTSIRYMVETIRL